MADEIDRANERAEQDLALALSVRKPVPKFCEDCDEPCAVLPNGARARFCDAHLADFMGASNG